MRIRIVLSVITPVIIALLLLSSYYYMREQRLLEAQLQLAARQLGQVMFGSLHHAMLANDFDLASHILADVGDIENIDRLQLLDRDGVVILDSQSRDQGVHLQTTDAGCIECHALPSAEMPRTARLSAGSNVLRIVTPIDEMPECMQCHAEGKPSLGVLLMDVSTNTLQGRIQGELKSALLITVAIVLFIALGTYLIMDWLVVRRLEFLHQPLMELAEGNLSIRIPVNDVLGDEISDLAKMINQLAYELERHTWEQEERSLVRQQAIMEERERIARELHDGFAQIPVYVNVKARAVRMMLENGQMEQAKTHLSQLEEAAKELLVEVREAVVSLRLSSQVGSGLKTGLQSYVDQLTRLSGLKVDLEISPEIDQLDLDSETELQLFRIVQEALTNVRKHSGARQAQVSLQLEDDSLKLVIQDDGKGFDQERTRPRGASGFGIKNMAERAQMIGADLHIDPLPGGGTRVTVLVSLKKGGRYASAGGR